MSYSKSQPSISSELHFCKKGKVKNKLYPITSHKSPEGSAGITLHNPEVRGSIRMGGKRLRGSRGNLLPLLVSTQDLGFKPEVGTQL
jgi:hypothetical protein